MTPPRIAFVDLLFSWPPLGGADADVFHVVRCLRDCGYDVRLFAAKYLDSRERPGFDPEDLPFPATRLEFTRATLEPNRVASRFREAVDAWRPDAVFLGFGYFLKPFVIEALAHYPIATRYYAYEAACPRDLRLFKNGAPCPHDYLHTPDACRRCALEAMAPEIRAWHPLTWTEECLRSRALFPGYYPRLIRSLQYCWTIVGYNDSVVRHFEGIHGDVRVVPGGVRVADFTGAPAKPKTRDDVKAILMTGRGEDPAKGLPVLLEAGERLARSRADFEIRASVQAAGAFGRTRTNTDEHGWRTEANVGFPRWFKPLGWRPPAELPRQYAEADICVVPSIWEEPFGIVAVEAMASARPVCAARVGGLRHIVQDGVTGFLFERGDASELASCLDRLLDDPKRRAEMGAASRRRAEAEYDWPRVVEKHYVPIVEGLLRKAAVPTQYPHPSTLSTTSTSSTETPPFAKGGQGLRVAIFYSPGRNLAQVLRQVAEQCPKARRCAIIPEGRSLSREESAWVDETLQLGRGAYGIGDPIPLLKLVLQLRRQRFDVFVAAFDTAKLRLLAAAIAPRRFYCALDGRLVALAGGFSTVLANTILGRLKGIAAHAALRAIVRRCRAKPAKFSPRDI